MFSSATLFASFSFVSIQLLTNTMEGTLQRCRRQIWKNEVLKQTKASLDPPFKHRSFADPESTQVINHNVAVETCIEDVISALCRAFIVVWTKVDNFIRISILVREFSRRRVQLQFLEVLKQVIHVCA